MTSDFKFVLFLTRCWKRIIKVLWSNLRIFFRNPSRLLELRALLVSRRMFRISGTCTVKRSRTLIANFIKKIKIFFFLQTCHIFYWNNFCFKGHLFMFKNCLLFLATDGKLFFRTFYLVCRLYILKEVFPTFAVINNSLSSFI